MADGRQHCLSLYIALHVLEMIEMIPLALGTRYGLQIHAVRAALTEYASDVVLG